MKCQHKGHHYLMFNQHVTCDKRCLMQLNKYLCNIISYTVITATINRKYCIFYVFQSKIKVSWYFNCLLNISGRTESFSVIKLLKGNWTLKWRSDILLVKLKKVIVLKHPEKMYLMHWISPPKSGASTYLLSPPPFGATFGTFQGEGETGTCF